MKVMADGFKTVTETGNYTYSTIEYAGRVAYSIVDKGGTAAKQCLVKGKYVPATVEYAGLLTYSVINRGGTATKQCLVKVSRPVGSAVERPLAFVKDKVFQPVGSAVERPLAFVKDKVFQPVGSAVSRPLAFVKDKAKNIFPEQVRYDEDIKQLLEKIMKIEDRLSYIEKHGVVMKGEAAGGKKAVSTEKRNLLQVILAENKLLRETG